MGIVLKKVLAPFHIRQEVAAAVGVLNIGGVGSRRATLEGCKPSTPDEIWLAVFVEDPKCLAVYWINLNG